MAASPKTAQLQARYGPWAVVAGASEGLGAEYARQLAHYGLNLVLVARREAQLNALTARLRQECGIEARSLVLDLSNPEAVSAILAATQNLDVGLLVYNAAFSAVGRFLDRPVEDHLLEIDTNVRAPLMLLHAFGQRMIRRGRGGVILMSSLSALQGSAMVANYAATKAYNILIAEGLWEEWRDKGVDVLVCLAGAIRTPNYLSSAPNTHGKFLDPSSEPAGVAASALRALGKQPHVIPGAGNRLASFFLRHFLPRQVAIRFMGRILRGMYEHETS